MTPTASSSPSHRRGPAVERRVLDTTLSLLSRQGYELTVDDVAEGAGVHKTTVYRRWETKALLVAAALRLLTARPVAEPASGDPLADLEELAVQLARALRRPEGANALSAALAVAGTDRRLRGTAAGLLGARDEVAGRLVREAQARGVLQAELDPALLWRAVADPLHVAAVLGTAHDDRTARALVATVLAGARRSAVPRSVRARAR